MKKEKKTPVHRVPIFDESILTPIGDEVVRAVCTQPNKEAAFEKYCKEKSLMYINANENIRAALSVAPERKYLLDHIHPNASAGVIMYSEAVLSAKTR